MINFVDLKELNLITAGGSLIGNLEGIAEYLKIGNLPLIKWQGNLHVYIFCGIRNE